MKSQNEMVHPNQLTRTGSLSAAPVLDGKAVQLLRFGVLKGWTRGALRGPEAQFLSILRKGLGVSDGKRVASHRNAVSLVSPQILARLASAAYAQREEAALGAVAPETLARYQAGKLTFGDVLNSLAEQGPKGFALAKQLLDERWEAIQEFFESWSESLRENAKLDKESSEKSQEKAALQKQIDLRRIAGTRRALAAQLAMLQQKQHRLAHVHHSQLQVIARPAGDGVQMMRVMVDSYGDQGVAPAVQAGVISQAALEEPDAEVGVQLQRRRQHGLL